LEKQMDSVLRPRDIQARIRAGEAPEDVAAAAQTTVDEIMGFATPVLAERAYQAQLAQRASIRRRAATGHVGNLGAAVTARLETLDVDPASVEWDAWRREDGRWTVVAAYVARGEHHQAAFTYDAGGRFVVADDDEARALVGERTVESRDESTTAPATAETAPPAHRGPVDAVEGVSDHAEQLPLGDDAIDIVTGRRLEQAAPAPDRLGEDDVEDTAGHGAEQGAEHGAGLQGEVTLDLTDTSQAVRSAGAGARPAGTADADWISTQASERPPAPDPGPADPPADPPATAPAPDAPRPDGAPESEPWDSPGSEETVEGDAREEEQEEATDALFDVPSSAKKPARAGRARGRASVPSWDEIMFGTPKSE
jgi:hypothetical protein